MKIIISNASMVPIYEQIMDQIKSAIVKGDTSFEEALPSVRSLAKDLKISALTVKKAYDNLEREGFIVTIHGKGSFIANTNADLLLEEQKKEVEADLEKAVQKAKQCGMSLQEIQDLITLIMEG
ncbi:GntR family transcriptional regulator [Amedibacillus sp. YH-ame10]